MKLTQSNSLRNLIVRERYMRNISNSTRQTPLLGFTSHPLNHYLVISLVLVLSILSPSINHNFLHRKLSGVLSSNSNVILVNASMLENSMND